jgi:hypothetical protein
MLPPTQVGIVVLTGATLVATQHQSGYQDSAVSVNSVVNDLSFSLINDHLMPRVFTFLNSRAATLFVNFSIYI